MEITYNLFGKVNTQNTEFADSNSREYNKFITNYNKFLNNQRNGDKYKLETLAEYDEDESKCQNINQQNLKANETKFNINNSTEVIIGVQNNKNNSTENELLHIEISQETYKLNAITSTKHNTINAKNSPIQNDEPVLIDSIIFFEMKAM
jgi:stress response protein YsnF